MGDKVSEELKKCLAGECRNCACHETQTAVTCKKLLERAYYTLKDREYREEKNRRLAPGEKVYAANSSLGVLEYTVDKRVSTKEGTALHCSARSETEGDCAATLLDKREFDLWELGETFFTDYEGAEKVLGQMKGCEAFAEGDKVYEIFLDEEDAFVLELTVEEVSADGLLTNIGYLQRSEFGIMFFARKDEAVREVERLMKKP